MPARQASKLRPGAFGLVIVNQNNALVKPPWQAEDKDPSPDGTEQITPDRVKGQQVTAMGTPPTVSLSTSCQFNMLMGQTRASSAIFNPEDTAFRV
jgi:hypothetical protein